MESFSRLQTALLISGLVACSHASADLVITEPVRVGADTDLGAIWFVGDSITQSNADGDSSGSPRKSLYDLLTANSYTFSYTGHFTANIDGLPASGGTPETNRYHYHSGISGSVIGDNIGGRTGMTQNLPSHWTSGRLATVKPDVILVMLGTNDTNSDIDVANAPSRLSAYIDAVYTQANVGNPTILLASIPPNRIDAARAQRVIDFNAAIPGIVTAQRSLGRDVHFVDNFTLIDNDYANLMRSDNLHPNAAGNDAMAQQWFNKIEEIVDDASISGTGPLIPLGDSVSAETDNSVEAGRATVLQFHGDISTSDLIATGSGTLLNAAMDKASFRSIAPGAAALNDGLGFPASGNGTGAFLPITFGTKAQMPFTYTVTLDTTTNTAGYDISTIKTFAGWNQNGSSLANQKFELLVSTVDNTDFTSLGIYTYVPFDSADTAEAGSSRLTLAMPGGDIASGVDQLRFIFMDPGEDNGIGAVDGTVYHEIDVIGSAVSVPPVPTITTEGCQAAAETNSSTTAGFPTASAFSADILSDDLINTGQAILSSAAWDKTPFFATDPVNDGQGHSTDPKYNASDNVPYRWY